MNKMKLLVVGFGILLVLIAGFVSAHEHDFAETKQLIDSGISCDKLSDEQLEEIGGYYMEQMHPGEAHEMMDQMMGGEGSDSLKQVHIQMAKRLYCNEDIGGMMGGGMMNMMMGNNVMGSGMMGNYPAGYAYSNYGYWNIFWILLFVAVIFLIVWIVYRFGIKKTASETPLNILKKRFAEGEITKKEFDDMKKEIGD